MRKSWLVVAALVLLAVWSSRSPQPAGGGPSTVVFPLKVSGKSWQPQIVGVPGKKIGNANVKEKNLRAVILGTLADFAADYLDLDPSGRFFLYYDDNLTWRVATNSSGDDTTTLNGQVSNDGVAWMFGTYTLPLAAGDGDVFVFAKVKFEKGHPFAVYVPKSVKGVLYFSSTDINTGLVMKFKTEKPLV